jgi:hypothetical protein
MKGISKSGLQALYGSVSKFKEYLKNEHNPFPEEHFVLGQLVEDKLVDNADLVNEKYVVKELSFPKTDSLDYSVFQLLLESGLDWSDITDDTKVLLTQQAGMSDKYKENTRIKKVDALEDLYKTYRELYEQEKCLVHPNTDDKSNEAVMALKSSKFRDLLDYDLAKVQLDREVDGFTIKGEIDWLIINEDKKYITIVDLKTYGQKASQNGWVYQCLKLGYFEQPYNYIELVKANYPGYSVSFVFLVVDVMNTVFTHWVSQDEYDIGKYGYTYKEGKPIIKAENKYPGFITKFNLYKWYNDTFGEAVDNWPDENPDLIKTKFEFKNGVL